MMNFKTFITILFLSIFFSSAYAARSIDCIAAVVNDGIITERQVQNEMHNIRGQLQLAKAPIPSEKDLHEKVLTSLIDKELQLQMAKSMGITVSDAAVTSTVEDIAARNHITLDMLKQKLSSQGIDFANYTRDIREQMIISQVQHAHLMSNISVSDDEVSQIQGKIKTMRPSGAMRYHVIDIFMPVPENAAPNIVNSVKAKADKRMQEIRGGADFLHVAVAEAIASKIPNGGDFGWRTLDQLPDIFAQSVEKMTPGSVMGPMRAGNGYHIIKLVGVDGGVENARHYTNQTHVRHILIKLDKTTNDEIAKMRLLKLKEKLQQGANFAEMANANSQDNLTNTKGGDLGWIPEGILDPNFQKTMDQSKIGQIGGPVKTSFGWHLLQVLGRKRVEDTKDVMLNQARGVAYQQKIQQALPGWLQQLRSTAYIKRYSNA